MEQNLILHAFVPDPEVRRTWHEWRGVRLGQCGWVWPVAVEWCLGHQLKRQGVHGSKVSHTVQGIERCRWDVIGTSVLHRRRGAAVVL